MDDEGWPEESNVDESVLPPVSVVCFFDSSVELRGFVNECWHDLQAGFADAGAVPELAGLKWAAENVGARIRIDAGMEISLRLYPVIDGEHREDLGEGGAQPLLQLYDDGSGGVDPVQLRTLVEWLLEDILPYVGHYDASAIDERFAGESRSLVLSDTSGQLLELPPSLQGDF